MPDDWKEEHEEELSEEGEKKDYVDMSLFELLASPEEMKAYIKRLKNGLAQLPADVTDYIDSGDARAEIQQWWRETNDYLSSGGLLKDLQSAAKSLLSWESMKAFGQGLLTKEFYTGLTNDMTVGMLAHIEAFATGIDPRTGKKVNLPKRIDSLVQSFAKPAKIVKKIKAFDKIIDKLSIKAIDDKGSKSGKNGKDSKDNSNSINGKGGKEQNGGGNNEDGDKGKDSGKDSSDGKKEINSPIHLSEDGINFAVSNQSRMQHAFKHGKDLGFGNWNKQTAKE